MDTNSNAGATGGTPNGATGVSGVQATPGTGTPGAGAAPGTGGGTPSPAPIDWTATLPDESRGYVQTKGFKDPAAVVDSYRHLEKLMGAPKERLLTIPEKLDDPKVMGPIWDKLGRPQKPEEYMLETPKEGGDKDFTDWAAKTFHEEGLTRAQATKLVEHWNKFVGVRTEAVKTAHNQKFETEVKGLKTEWGAEFDQNMDLGKKAAATFGISKEQIDALEKSLGTAKTFKLFHHIGSKLGEHSFVDGQSGTNFGGNMTPQQAKWRLDALKQDQDWVRRYTSGDVSARQEMERLQIFMNQQAG